MVRLRKYTSWVYSCNSPEESYYKWNEINQKLISVGQNSTHRVLIILKNAYKFYIITGIK